MRIKNRDTVAAKAAEYQVDQSADSESTVAQEIAQAVITFQKERGAPPTSVTVLLGADTLVVTLHGTFSPAEQALAKTPEGVAFLQKHHEKVFASSWRPLRQQIERITGVEVREAIAGFKADPVVQAFSTGTMVQVFQFAQCVPADSWSGNGDGETGPPLPAPTRSKLPGVTPVSEVFAAR
jgi:uncharacterized protein YbcI